MAEGFRQALLTALGFFDYVQEKMYDLREEWLERGERRQEDFKEFIADLLENFPMIAKGLSGGNGEAEPEKQQSGGFEESNGKSGIGGMIREFVDSLGLATGADLKNITSRLEELQDNLRAAGKK